ncbi:hypothetical protein BDL97_10G097700 [Sphagnum fallax]|nr:hypothetical protein BDL97_10G097700 [Sphagnum fallax]
MARIAGVISILVGILICMSIHLDVVVVHAMRTPASIFWDQMLPFVQAIPATLKVSVSPVEGTATADQFATAVTGAMSFPALSAKFCVAAGLVCDEDIEIHSYTTKKNSSSTPEVPIMGRHNMMTHASAASRTMGITTINDFQLDFFLEENLVEGAYMHLADNLFDPIPLRAFLPSTVAKVLPALTTANLPKLLAAFTIDKNSRMAAMMATATYLCESPALPREQRACPTSVEEMAVFVASEVGEQLEVLSTRGAPTSAPATTTTTEEKKLLPVKVLSYTKRSLGEGKNIVVCHNLMFPSQLYYCHHVTGTKVVQASLGSSDGSVIHGVAICHMDTTLWASEHPAFAALNIPRGAEACHWNTQNDLIWIPTTSSTTSYD